MAPLAPCFTPPATEQLLLLSTAEGRELARVGPGQCFGELALLTGDNRACNVMALDSSKVLTLHREAFHQLLGSLEALRHLWRYEALRRVPLMDQLPEKSKMEVAAALAQLYTPKGSAVVTQVGRWEGVLLQVLPHTMCMQLLPLCDDMHVT